VTCADGKYLFERWERRVVGDGTGGDGVSKEWNWVGRSSQLQNTRRMNGEGVAADTNSNNE
jgi:hypothetical protein